MKSVGKSLHSDKVDATLMANFPESYTPQELFQTLGRIFRAKKLPRKLKKKVRKTNYGRAYSRILGGRVERRIAQKLRAKVNALKEELKNNNNWNDILT
jgi:hypothetical protein